MPNSLSDELFGKNRRFAKSRRRLPWKRAGTFVFLSAVLLRRLYFSTEVMDVGTTVRFLFNVIIVPNVERKAEKGCSIFMSKERKAP